MYDTLHLWIPTEVLSSDDLGQITQRMENVTEHIKQGRLPHITGRVCRTFRTSVNERGVSLRGSLAKYHFGNNYYTLTRRDSQEAIERLSDELILPVSEAKVTRIDMAQNFTMEHPAGVYYDYLGACRYYNRLRQPQSVSWQNKNRTKIIYDKVAEMNSRSVDIPVECRGKNVLRYEMRYKERLGSQFNQPVVTAGHLTDEVFYRGLIENFKSEYDSIVKVKRIEMDVPQVKTPNEFMQWLQLVAIQKIGHVELDAKIEEMRLRRQFSRDEYYSRAMKMIRQLGSKSSMHAQEQPIDELTAKVAYSARHFE